MRSADFAAALQDRPVSFGIKGARGCDAVVRHRLHTLVSCSRRRPVGGRITGSLFHGQGPARIRHQLLPCARDATTLSFLAGAFEGCGQHGALLLCAAVVRGWSRAGRCRLASDLPPLLAGNVAGTVPLLAQALDQVRQITIAEALNSWMVCLLNKFVLMTAQQSRFVPAGA